MRGGRDPSDSPNRQAPKGDDRSADPEANDDQNPEKEGQGSGTVDGDDGHDPLAQPDDQ